MGKVPQRNKNWKEDNEQLMSLWKTKVRAENRKGKCNEPGSFEVLGDCSKVVHELVKSSSENFYLKKVNLRCEKHLYLPFLSPL